MINRSPKSHKGENGKVCIISGSRDYYGATVLSALACMKSGVDLCFLVIPECNRIITATYSPSFIIRSYENTYLCPANLGEIYRLEEYVDCFLIGPGLSKNEKTLEAVSLLLSNLKKPLIIDADGLVGALYTTHLPNNSVITPHKAELEIILGKKTPKNKKNLEDELKNLSKKINATVLFKGPEDLIVHMDSDYKPEPAKIAYNKSGNESLTKGGTGDILAGIVTGLIAQKMDSFSSAKLAAAILGKASEKLFKKKKYNYLVEELIDEI